jgi:hypothetical protein
VKSKYQLRTKVVELVEELKYKGISDKFIRMYDSGENASIEKDCKEKCLGNLSSVVQGNHRGTGKSK